MSSVDLSSARAKLRRAVSQCGELESYIEQFRADPRNHAILRAEFDAHSGWHIVRIGRLPEYDVALEEVSLSVGDIVNNLRSCLDHLAWQYACAYSGGIPRRPKSVFFPSCNAADGQHKSPGFLDSTVWSRIHEYQPCRGVNGRPDGWSGPYVHQLDLLIALSNDDKHQRLVHIAVTPNQLRTIATRGDLPPWLVRTESGVEVLSDRINAPDSGSDKWDHSNSSNVAEVGAEVVRVRAPLWGTVAAIDAVGTAIPYFCLEEGRPVVETIWRLAKYVREVLVDVQEASHS